MIFFAAIEASEFALLARWRVGSRAAGIRVSFSLYRHMQNRNAPKKKATFKYLPLVTLSFTLGILALVFGIIPRPHGLPLVTRN